MNELNLIEKRKETKQTKEMKPIEKKNGNKIPEWYVK